MGFPISLRDTLRKKGKDNALLKWSPHRHKNMMLNKRPSSADQEQACRPTRWCGKGQCYTRTSCTWGRISGQGGVSAPGHRSFRPSPSQDQHIHLQDEAEPDAYDQDSIVRQDEDKNCGSVQEASNSHSMKPKLVS